MKGKVKCTCGWSWNKSDSSKKDMYICHECGRDNSNNMRNGGWLDNYGEQENYNDYKVSAPEGMVGDGFSNVGRNYSPAWGGQFENGGLISNAQKGKKVKPLYVESKNDPRYKAYQDSTALYKSSLKNMSAEKKDKAKITKKGFIPFDKFNTFILGSNLESNDENHYPGENFDAYKKKSTKVSKTKLNNLIKNNIKPIGFDINEFTKNNKKGTINYSTVYKKPEQEVIVQPKEVKPKEELVALQPMSVGLQDVDDGFETNLNIPTPVQRKPKYYNITDVNNQNFGGGATSYRVDSLDELRELPKELWDRKITPQYQMGGNIYPVNYVPQAQEGRELTFLQPTSNKLPEGYMKGSSIPSTERAMSIGGENGEPAYLIPSFKYGQELLGPVFDPISEFRRTGEHLGGPFKTWQEADEWERTVRHPAVENRETIMFPQEKFQTGGSIPGSVGFTYARTKGIPSEGPYAKKTLPSAQNGQEMKYYQEGLDWKPKTISREGSVIKDDRGQWDHPGEITEIDSPYITMQGVPYPVLGISDTGDVQMMYPEEEYEFDGEKVTEYPMAKNGLRQEQKGLQNLDNLLNFTNYNKPQPGGWLSKYE